MEFVTVGDSLAALIAGDSLIASHSALQRLTASHSASVPHSASQHLIVPTAPQCLTVPQCLRAPYSSLQLSVGCSSWWLLSVGDGWTINAGSVRDLLLAYLILGVPGYLG